MKNYVVPFFCSCRYIQQQYRYALSPDTMESENKQTNIAIFCPFHASTITIVYIQPFTLKCYLDIYKDYDVYIYILRGQAFFPNFKWAGSQIPTLHQEASGFWAFFMDSNMCCTCTRVDSARLNSVWACRGFTDYVILLTGLPAWYTVHVVHARWFLLHAKFPWSNLETP